MFFIHSTSLQHIQEIGCTESYTRAEFLVMSEKNRSQIFLNPLFKMNEVLEKKRGSLPCLGPLAMLVVELGSFLTNFLVVQLVVQHLVNSTKLSFPFVLLFCFLDAEYDLHYQISESLNLHYYSSLTLFSAVLPFLKIIKNITKA